MPAKLRRLFSTSVAKAVSLALAVAVVIAGVSIAERDSRAPTVSDALAQAQVGSGGPAPTVDVPGVAQPDSSAPAQRRSLTPGRPAAPTTGVTAPSSGSAVADLTRIGTSPANVPQDAAKVEAMARQFTAQTIGSAERQARQQPSLACQIYLAARAAIVNFFNFLKALFPFLAGLIDGLRDAALAALDSSFFRPINCAVPSPG